MKALTKVVPPSRVILNDIWLSFYPGAKIGVLGANGAGKSSVLRIMAGIDQDYNGEAWAAQGTKIGYLPQEPQLDPSLDVRGNVELAVKTDRAILDRFNEIMIAFGEQMSDKAMEKLLEEQGRLQEKIDHLDLWNLDNKIEVAMDALRCPPPDADVTTLSGGEKRRVALCRVLLEHPDLLLLDEPTNHLDAESVAWLEKHLEDFPGTVVAITHDRYFLDNVAKWILELDRGSGISVRGELLVVARPEADADGAGREDGQRPAAHAGARAGVGAHGAPRSSGEEQGAYPEVRGDGERKAVRDRSRRTKSSSRPRRGSATTSSSRTS